MLFKLWKTGETQRLKNRTMKNGYKKPQKSYDIWVFWVGIYLGCTIWLAICGYDVPTRKYIRLGRVRVERVRGSLFSPCRARFTSHPLTLQAHSLLWRS